MGELFDKLCSVPVLMDAWKRVRDKGAAGGLDGVSVEAFRREFDRQLEDLRTSLIQGRYTPEPLKRIDIPKNDGTRETRPLSLPAVRDKVVQQAARMVLEPLFEPIFLDCSYAYRPGRGSRRAFKQVHSCLAGRGKQWVALADFDRFFDTLDHDILIRQVSTRARDPELIRLIRLWARIGFVSRKGDYHDVTAGVGQGGVISPLLSNIYVHPLDEYVTQKGTAYVRYSDNFILLGRSRKEATLALDHARSFAEDALKLRLNARPRPVRALKHGFVFLGIYYRDDIREISRGKMAAIRRRVRKAARPGRDRDALIRRVRAVLGGIRAHYGFLRTEAQFEEIDGCLREALIPSLASLADRGAFERARDLVTALEPLEFLSESFQGRKPEHLHEIAADVMKHRLARQAQKPAQRRKPVREEVKQADRDIQRTKRRYVKERFISSELVVRTFGVFLGKRGNRLVVRLGRKNIASQPLDRLRSITVAVEGVSLSSDIVWACVRKEIPMFFMRHDGTVEAMVHSPAHPHADLGLLQLQAKAEGGSGARIAAAIVKGKIRNQVNLLKYYARSRKDEPEFVKKTRKMAESVRKLLNQAAEFLEQETGDALRDQLMGLEAQAALAYWSVVRDLLAPEAVFPGRKRKGAEDPVNSLLNYGYGILYARLWQAVQLAGLNPHLGFLHATGRDRPALIFDMVEEFRCQAVDRAVFTMISRGEPAEVEEKTGLLTEETRKCLVGNVFERLGSLVPYRSDKITLEEVVRRQPRHLADCLREGKAYRPFVGRY